MEMEFAFWCANCDQTFDVRESRKGKCLYCESQATYPLSWWLQTPEKRANRVANMGALARNAPAGTPKET